MSKEKEEEEERRERKEGVRVRVRLGVGGAIRNYCGTIDKRRLRGRTTEDSLRPSDFPSTVASLFRLVSLDFRSRVMLFYPYPCLAHETFQTRQYVMLKNPRATPPSSGRSTWNRRFYPCIFQWTQTAVGQVDPVNIRYFTILDTGTDMIMSKYLECFAAADMYAEFL